MKRRGTGVEVRGIKPTDRHGNAGGLAVWLLARLRGGLFRVKFSRESNKQRMELVERIALGPRQNLALVEADGRRFLIATSGESGPVFLALDGPMRASAIQQARISW